MGTRPPGAADFAESAYAFGGQAMYAESIYVYDDQLDARAVAWRRSAKCPTAEVTPSE